MHSKPDDDRDNQRPKNAQNARAIRQELGSRFGALFRDFLINSE